MDVGELSLHFTWDYSQVYISRTGTKKCVVFGKFVQSISILILCECIFKVNWRGLINNFFSYWRRSIFEYRLLEKNVCVFHKNCFYSYILRNAHFAEIKSNDSNDQFDRNIGNYHTLLFTTAAFVMTFPAVSGNNVITFDNCTISYQHFKINTEDNCFVFKLCV